MKTRSNMPLFVLEVSDVKALSNSQIDLLRCGDYLVKKDASGEHAYKVTFKSDTGMCLTYHDASVVETQSYDKVDGNWVYNSEDKSGNLIDDVKPIYIHPISIIKRSGSGKYNLGFIILNNDSTPFTFDTFKQFIDNLFTQIGGVVRMLCTGYYNNGLEGEDNKQGAVSVLAKINNTNFQIILGGADNPSTFHASTSWGGILGSPDEFTDGVNKIN